MPHTLSAIRELPNCELYQLKLVRVESPVTIVAVLTQKALDLGVRFDNDRKDYRFNLSEFLGNDDGKWTTQGANFETLAKNISLDLTDRKNRCLVADLRNADKDYNTGVKYNLDKSLGLVDYIHPKERETYFRLGAKVPNTSARTLVLCFDGTSNHFSNQNTNVVKIFELLKKDDPERQMVYYQTGVGTYTSQAWTDPMTQSVAKTADLAVAWYLYQHVIDGYKFLMETYRDGDQIYIFGFSRGAYTARALAGMLHCVGLLPRHNIEHAPFAYQIYSSQTPETISKLATARAPNTPDPGTPSEDALTEELKPEDIEPDTVVPEDVAPSNAQLVGNPPDVPPPNNSRKSATPEIKCFGGLGRGGSSEAKDTDPEAYKQTFCTSIMIDFVGVWDTVGSVGAIIPRTLQYIDHNPSIRIFRHALALDEHRANFVPSLWDHARTVSGQDVREVWFRGQHTDVGGGAPPPATRAKDDPEFTALSNISLRWMVQQCLENKTSIAFDRGSMELYREARVLESRPAQPDLSMHKAKIKQARLESVERTQAALAEAMQAAQEHRRRLYEGSSKLDRIDIKHTPFEAVGVLSPWKFLELFPSTRPAQTEKGPEMTHWPNLGKTRMIYRRSPTEPVFIHASVVDFLLSDKGKAYVPSAYWYGFSKGEFPRIESFEGNRMDWPDDEHTREGLKSVIKMDWIPASGVLDRFKRWAGW